MPHPARTTPPTPPPPPPLYEDALVLEVDIVRLMLRRNRCQHFRAQYYRRMDMVVRAIDGKASASAAMAMAMAGGGVDGGDGSDCRRHRRTCRSGSTYRGVRESGRAVRIACAVADEMDARIARFRNGKGGTIDTRRRQQQQQQRDINREKKRNKDNVKMGPISDVTNTLLCDILVHIPLILRRIIHASEALCAELARGYFVPVCSVLLASAARMRLILMRMGRDGCDSLCRLSAVLDVASRGGDDDDDDDGDDNGNDVASSTCLLPHTYNVNDVRCARNILKSKFRYDSCIRQFVDEPIEQHEASVRRKRRNALLRRSGMIQVSSSLTAANNDNDNYCNDDNGGGGGKDGAIDVTSPLSLSFARKGRSTSFGCSSGGGNGYGTENDDDDDDEDDDIGKEIDAGVRKKTLHTVPKKEEWQMEMNPDENDDYDDCNTNKTKTPTEKKKTTTTIMSSSLLLARGRKVDVNNEIVEMMRRKRKAEKDNSLIKSTTLADSKKNTTKKMKKYIMMTNKSMQKDEQEKKREKAALTVTKMTMDKNTTGKIWNKQDKQVNDNDDYNEDDDDEKDEDGKEQTDENEEDDEKGNIHPEISRWGSVSPLPLNSSQFVDDVFAIAGGSWAMDKMREKDIIHDDDCDGGNGNGNGGRRVGANNNDDDDDDHDDKVATSKRKDEKRKKKDKDKKKTIDSNEKDITSKRKSKKRNVMDDIFNGL